MKIYYSKETMHGYLLLGIKTSNGFTVALLQRATDFQPYIVAWNYEENSDTWGQGHYYSDMKDAMNKWKSYK